MENQIKTATASLDLAIKAANTWKRPDDAEQIARIVTVIGEMEREAYLALRSEWRARYKAISLESRRTKPQRKGGNTTAQGRCVTLRKDARELMQVRYALKACARAHAAKSGSTAAAA
nr:hypothetical protein [Neorhizobium tomejilense]